MYFMWVRKGTWPLNNYHSSFQFSEKLHHIHLKRALEQLQAHLTIPKTIKALMTNWQLILLYLSKILRFVTSKGKGIMNIFLLLL